MIFYLKNMDLHSVLIYLNYIFVRYAPYDYKYIQQMMML